MKIKSIIEKEFNDYVYNIGVDNNNNYFVNEVLVHNCYQSSLNTVKHHKDILKKFKQFFEPMSDNQRPFQIALGGGEPTSHPRFLELIKTSHEFGITPNYTTNGMWVSYSKKKQDEILRMTKEYCGGVAVSTHKHLEKYWKQAVEKYLEKNIFTNLHIIIGNRKSIDEFNKVYKEYNGRINYFVLLPLSAQGRSKESFSDWDYLEKSIEGSPANIAFGANFYPYLYKDKNRFKVSLYTPELMSAYLDIETMKVYKSSFSSEIRKVGI